jgi:hypothetical protein
MHKTEVSIWFFNGLMLTVYGLMIGGYGVYELISGQTPPVVLANLHPSVWWGGMMLILGVFYCVKFFPRQQR